MFKALFNTFNRQFTSINNHIHSKIMSSSSNDHSPNPISSKRNDDINKNMNELAIVYKECLKNHVASLGGNARDGCGEFMPTVENRLNCSACGCHRNFHRREVDISSCAELSHPYYWSANPMIHQEIMQCYQTKQSNTGLLRARCGPYDLSMGPVTTFPKTGENDGEGGKSNIEGNCLNKKRHRTKFTREQKEKMLMFAEEAEWKIQKMDERLVQQFCQEVEIKRRVLKVWMHNNKQHYVKKHASSNSASIDHIIDS